MRFQKCVDEIIIGIVYGEVLSMEFMDVIDDMIEYLDLFKWRKVLIHLLFRLFNNHHDMKTVPRPVGIGEIMFRQNKARFHQVVLTFLAPRLKFFNDILTL